MKIRYFFIILIFTVILVFGVTVFVENKDSKLKKLQKSEIEYILGASLKGNNIESKGSKKEDIELDTIEKLYAKSACVLDAKSKRVLYAKDAYNVMSMASTTKIMTCIIAL